MFILLVRVSKFLTLKKKRDIFSTFVESQFKHYLLIWMFHSRCGNNKINRLHERALKIVYNDYESSFDQVLVNDRCFRIHRQKSYRLTIEILNNTIILNIK